VGAQGAIAIDKFLHIGWLSSKQIVVAVVAVLAVIVHLYFIYCHLLLKSKLATAAN
jgi:hypothetical protein